jgi:methylmalonyl-CoA mutase
MSVLSQIADAVDTYNRSVEKRVEQVRSDAAAGQALLDKWREIRERIPTTVTPTGLTLPRLALPELDEAGAIARYLGEEGLPGDFPFVSSAYREMYLESLPELSNGNGDARSNTPEEPTRLFAGLGLAEDTNARFHYLTKHQRSVRLSTAFDGPTLYGLDSDADGAAGKIGEGGVAVDTVEDMLRLFDGFDLACLEGETSVSMTINGPAPAILAMYVAAAKRRFGEDVVPKLRGTIQADILKEVQAQNECLFPAEASLRFLGDMVEYVSQQMPRFYPISISGYHIAEAGATPVQQAAYTLSNGFAYVEMFRERGMDVDLFGPRLSFFLDCGLEIEYFALARVCRKLWAIAMRDVFKAGDRAQRFKLHTQTSGRSLIAAEFKNNLTRTAIELLMSYANATNSCHSNSADEPFTTPGEEYVRLAAQGQSILLEESGLFKHMMNTVPGSPGMKALEKAVEAAILEVFREMDQMGGVLAAVEQRYQRSQIQAAAYRMERQIQDGTRPIIGLNRYASENGHEGHGELVRPSKEKQQSQIDRLKCFKEAHAKESGPALDRLEQVVESGGNVFAELLNTVEVCSLGQITDRLHEVSGHYRPTV